MATLLVLLLALMPMPHGKKPRYQGFVPLPPRIHYVNALPPGYPAGTRFTAGADGDTVYYQGKLDKYRRYHETGHVYDDELLTDADRRWFTRLMGLKGDWVTAGTSALGGMQGGDRSPNEWFADWYSNAALRNDPMTGWDYGYAGPPENERTYKQFVRRVRRIQRRPRYTTP